MKQMSVNVHKANTINLCSAFIETGRLNKGEKKKVLSWLNFCTRMNEKKYGDVVTLLNLYNDILLMIDSKKFIRRSFNKEDEEPWMKLL
jgi:hypothetical protein